MTGRQGILTMPGIILLVMCLIMIGGMLSGFNYSRAALLHDGGVRRRASGARRLPELELRHGDLVLGDVLPGPMQAAAHVRGDPSRS